MKGLVLTFPNNTTENVDYVVSSLIINETYFNSLKNVDNNCRLKAVFSIALSNKLKQYADENIVANVYNNDEELVFAGYLRKTFTFTKTQKNQPIDLEIVSPSYLLDKELSAEIFRTNETVGAIINLLGADVGFSLGCTITKTVDYFRAKKGDKIKSIIEELLFEYGFTFDFKTDGSFVTYPLFNQPGDDNIAHEFTGSDCLTQIQIQRTEKQYTGVTAKWQKKEYCANVLLYEDTQGATTSAACSIEVPPRSYMYGENNDNGRNYLQFDSTKGEVLFATYIRSSFQGTYIESLQTDYENCGDSVLWKCYNPSLTITATFHKFQWWGNAWIATSTNESKTTVTGDKSLELSLSYLNDGTAISSFIQKVADYYRYSLFKVTLKSKEDVSVGSFVTVTDYGIGTITGRILSKSSSYTGVYTYTIESVSEYVPSSLELEKNTISKNPSDGITSNIAQIKSVTDSLQAQIDAFEYTGTTCQLDINTIILDIDSEGKTKAEQSFTVLVSLRNADEEMDFFIGNDDNPLVVPDGWSYVINKDKITFTIEEGTKVKSGNVKIPVVFTPILSNEPFIDENNNIFVDEHGNYFVDIVYGTGGTVWNLYLSYLGNGYAANLRTFTTIAQIEHSQPNIGDYFTWGGTNNTESDLVEGGYLKQGRIYHYIGDSEEWSWEEDTDTNHIQNAMSDVLALSNADLEHNNSDVWEYLDHLTTNSAYIGLLTANQAFIEELSSKIITANKVIVKSDLGFEDDDDTTIIENGKIKTSKLESTVVTTNEITSGSGTFTGLKADRAEFTNCNVTGEVKASYFSLTCEPGDKELIKIKALSAGGLVPKRNIWFESCVKGSVDLKGVISRGTSTSAFSCSLLINDVVFWNKTYLYESIESIEYNEDIGIIQINEGDIIKAYIEGGDGRASASSFTVTFLVKETNYITKKLINLSLTEE